MHVFKYCLEIYVLESVMLALPLGRAGFFFTYITLPIVPRNTFIAGEHASMCK
jgi:hypothetical protein